MNILVTSVIDPQAAAHSRLHNFLDYLSHRHNVTVLAIRDTWKQQFGRGLRHTAQRYPYKIHYLPGSSPIIQEPLAVFSAPRLLRQIIPTSIDVHFNYNSLGLGYAVDRFLRPLHIPSVLDLADDLVALVSASPQIPLLFRPFGTALARWFLTRNIANAVRISVMSTQLARTGKLPAEKVVIIPNGGDFRRFRLSRCLKPHDPLRIIYVGVLREWVDLQTAFAALPRGATLRIVGGEGFLRETQAKTRLHNVARQVKFRGAVPYKEISRELAWADVGIIPFKIGAIAQGALPLKLFEYTAAGLPVISSPIPEVERIGGEAVTICRTVQDWRAAFQLVSREYPTRKRHALTLRRNVSAYDWSELSKQLERILEGVVT